MKTVQVFHSFVATIATVLLLVVGGFANYFQSFEPMPAKPAKKLPPGQPLREWRPHVKLNSVEPIEINRAVRGRDIFKGVRPDEAHTALWFSTEPGLLRVGPTDQITPLFDGPASVCMQPDRFDSSKYKCWLVDVVIGKPIR